MCCAGPGAVPRVQRQGEGGRGGEVHVPEVPRRHRRGAAQVQGRGLPSIPLQLYRYSIISVADSDPGSGAFLTPGSGMGKNQDPNLGKTARIIFPRA